ncbi:Stimulated by retinoic acid gene 6 protein-like [Varanus komodoensis]|nr:Stimulated by retinoic acid gene 6 protein-like [Varanus komodoensis]
MTTPMAAPTQIFFLLLHRPLDFMGAYSNRWSLSFAFGATATKVMILFSEGYGPEQVLPQWAHGKRCSTIRFGLLLIKSIAGFILSAVFNHAKICSPPDCPCMSTSNNFSMENNEKMKVHILKCTKT